MPQNNHHSPEDKLPEFRLFLSSTFTDLQPEREQLVKKVFPQIRAIARERGVEFTEIDLRWGITDEEARSGKTIRICLEEIDRCRPYFLGIIGSRYGWTPEISVIEQDASLLKDYPWLAAFAEENKSITDMEFSHGAILPCNIHHAFIYDQIIERKSSDLAPIEGLRSRIVAAGIPHHQFASPVELGEKVLDDLTAILDRDFPIKKEMTPAERERNPHEAFAHNRTHSYIANPEYYERFETFVESIDAPLILWGKSGFGKSALMAHLTSEYRHHHPEVFIVRHFVGATAGASSMDDVMRHVMLEIKERYELIDEIPASNLQSEFPVWLAKIPEGEKLILAIDAVNQLTGIGNEMHWLPEFIPANVRLIISTTPEILLDELRKRNWQELEILPLSPQQRKRIAHEYLAKYHKHLQPELLEVIAEEEKLESPLFLRTLLEELRIFGQHSALDLHLADYLSSANEAELFQKVLVRMERDHGKDTVRSIMTAIWASRFGLSETELLGITGLTRLALSEFLITLEFHLMRRTGLFTFFHNYLREAIEFRYLNSEEIKKSAYKKLAEYFSGIEYGARRRDEEAWAWRDADENNRLVQCISNSEMLHSFMSTDREYDLLSHWVHLDLNGLVESYTNEFKAYEIRENSEQCCQFAFEIGRFLQHASKLHESVSFLEKSLSLAEVLYGKESPKLDNILDALTATYTELSQFSEAISYAERRLFVLDKEDPEYIIQRASCLISLSTLSYFKGDFERAKNYCYQVLETTNSQNYQMLNLRGQSLGNLGSIYSAEGKMDLAVVNLKEAIQIYSQVHGHNHAETLNAQKNLAVVLFISKQYQESEKVYQLVSAAFEQTIGPSHLLLALHHEAYAHLLYECRRFDECKVFQIKSLNIRKKHLSENDLDLVQTYLGLAEYCKQTNDLEESEQLYRQYLPISEQLLGKNSERLIKSKRRFADVLLSLGKRNESEKILAGIP